MTFTRFLGDHLSYLGIIRELYAFCFELNTTFSIFRLYIIVNFGYFYIFHEEIKMTIKINYN